MNITEIKSLFAEARSSYAGHPFFSIVIPLIARTRIMTSGTTKTACISRDEGEPLLRLNPTFCMRNVKSPEDILFLLSHEICHYVLGHLNSPLEKLEHSYGHFIVNLALDIIIDQMLYRQFGEKTDCLKIVDFYKESECPVRLLLPPSRVNEEEFKEDRCKEVLRQISSGQKLTPYRLIRHIISHKEYEYQSLFDDTPWYRRFRGGCRHPASPGGKFGQLGEILMHGMGQSGHQSAIRSSAVPFKKRFPEAIREIAQNGEGRIDEHVRGGGVLPYWGRRDFIALAAGNPVVIYHANPLIETDKGIRVYLDVSGSMDEDMPKVFAALDSIRDYITFPLYAFSTEVHPVTRAKLAARQVLSLGGTDFNCVAEHAIKHRHDKILLVTDGVSDMKPAYEKTLKQNHAVLTVLSRMGRNKAVRKFSTEVLRME